MGTDPAAKPTTPVQPWLIPVCDPDTMPITEPRLKQLRGGVQLPRGPFATEKERQDAIEKYRTELGDSHDAVAWMDGHRKAQDVSQGKTDVDESAYLDPAKAHAVTTYFGVSFLVGMWGGGGKRAKTELPVSVARYLLPIYGGASFDKSSVCYVDREGRKMLAVPGQMVEGIRQYIKPEAIPLDNVGTLIKGYSGFVKEPVPLQALALTEQDTKGRDRWAPLLDKAGHPMFLSDIEVQYLLSSLKMDKKNPDQALRPIGNEGLRVYYIDQTIIERSDLLRLSQALGELTKSPDLLAAGVGPRVQYLQEAVETLASKVPHLGKTQILTEIVEYLVPEKDLPEPFAHALADPRAAAPYLAQGDFDHVNDDSLLEIWDQGKGLNLFGWRPLSDDDPDYADLDATVPANMLAYVIAAAKITGESDVLRVRDDQTGLKDYRIAVRMTRDAISRVRGPVLDLLKHTASDSVAERQVNQVLAALTAMDQRVDMRESERSNLLLFGTPTVVSLITAGIAIVKSIFSGRALKREKAERQQEMAEVRAERERERAERVREQEELRRMREEDRADRARDRELQEKSLAASEAERAQQAGEKDFLGIGLSPRVAFQRYTINLVDKYMHGESPPGDMALHKEAIKSVARIVAAGKNPILLGIPGVGKSVIWEGLGWLIAQGRTDNWAAIRDPELRGLTHRLVKQKFEPVSLNQGEVNARRVYDSGLSIVMNGVITGYNEITRVDGKKILLQIGEIYAWLTDPDPKAQQVKELLKDALAKPVDKGGLRIGGDTTVTQFEKAMAILAAAGDTAMDRRVQGVPVEDKSPREVAGSLRTMLDQYGAARDDFPPMRFAEGVVDAVVAAADGRRVKETNPQAGQLEATKQGLISASNDLFAQIIAWKREQTMVPWPDGMTAEAYNSLCAAEMSKASTLTQADVTTYVRDVLSKQPVASAGVDSVDGNVRASMWDHAVRTTVYYREAMQSLLRNADPAVRARVMGFGIEAARGLMHAATGGTVESYRQVVSDCERAFALLETEVSPPPRTDPTPPPPAPQGKPPAAPTPPAPGPRPTPPAPPAAPPASGTKGPKALADADTAPKAAVDQPASARRAALLRRAGTTPVGVPATDATPRGTTAPSVTTGPRPANPMRTARPLLNDDSHARVVERELPKVLARAPSAALPHGPRRGTSRPGERPGRPEPVRVRGH
ncbi:MAG: hypothetical protein HY696_00750 [Deltaproteobacteria bacterium]|nr:hypothetical protein [Deltaproteobacteria bacterium]